MSEASAEAIGEPADIAAAETGGLRKALRARRLGRIHTPWDFRESARRRLPRMVFDYIDGGAGDERSVRENRAAIERVRLMPSAPHDTTTVDLSTTLFGQHLSMPVIIGPTGLASASWPRGEIALARAAAKAGIRFVLTNNGSIAPQEIAAVARGNSWFQLYAPPDRELARQWIGQAKAEGFSALEITVDAARPGRRMRDSHNGFTMPFKWTPKKFMDCATRPVWAMKMLWHGQPSPYLEVEKDPSEPKARNQSELRCHRFTRALSWDLLKMVRDEWDGPLIIKGLMDPREAQNAVAAGYDGIVLSNHGGRQLPDAVAPMEVLPEFKSEVGDRITLLIDGGFRSGSDIVKALALGASAVQLGRLTVFALATAGEDGVSHCLELLREEMENTMALCGRTSIPQLDRSMVRVGT